MKLYKIIVKPDSDEGLRFTVRDFEVEEKGKTYKYVTEDKKPYYPDFSFLKKEKLLFVDSIYYNSQHPIMYHTYCLKEQRIEAINKLLDTITKQINERILELNKLVDIKALIDKDDYVKKFKNKSKEMGDE